MVVRRPRRNVQKRCDLSAMKFWFENLILCLFVLPLLFSLFLSPLLVSLRNRTAERRGWRAWQTWQSCYLGVFVVIFTQHYFFLVFYKYTCLKEGEVWRKVYSNKIIVTHVREGLPSSFLSRPVAYVHYYPGMILSYLIALTFSILA